MDKASLLDRDHWARRKRLLIEFTALTGMEDENDLGHPGVQGLNGLKTIFLAGNTYHEVSFMQSARTVSGLVVTLRNGIAIKMMDGVDLVLDDPSILDKPDAFNALMTIQRSLNGQTLRQGEPGEELRGREVLNFKSLFALSNGILITAVLPGRLYLTLDVALVGPTGDVVRQQAHSLAGAILDWSRRFHPQPVE